MSEQMINFPVNGTAALKPSGRTNGPRQARVIAFPHNKAHSASAVKAPASGKLRMRIWNALLASEMYCSLRNEDARGVLYGMFTRGNMLALSMAGFAIAVLAIAFGS